MLRSPTQRQENARRRLWMAAGGFLALVFVLLTAAAILALRWPFSQENIVESIQEIVPGAVQIGEFRTRIFPHPGCEAEEVNLRRGASDPNKPPLVAVQRISIEARYFDLLFRPGYVARIVLQGLHVYVPARGSYAKHSGDAISPSSLRQTSKTRVGEILAEGALLEVGRQNDKDSLKFEIHSLTLGSVSRDSAWAYKVSMTNPIPPGEITSSGRLGPWKTGHFGKTPVAGRYQFRDANLAALPGIAGVLSSDDHFEGELDEINLHGAVEVPNFELKDSQHEVALHAQYSATVNALNGDVSLREVRTSFLQTTVVAAGQVAGRKGQKGKTTSLNITVHEGRIQDVLSLFVQDDKPPLMGITNFQADILLPPDRRQFLRKVNLRGDFAIRDGRFSNPETETEVDKLSQRARGNSKQASATDPERALSTLNGHVLLRDGVATFTNVKFAVPAASADLEGNYDLISEKVDFHGVLRTEAELSQTTSGVKSVLLKPLDRFFKKNNAGAQIPVSLTGTYSDPHFGVDLNPAHKLTRAK
jgi:hypothetical protein